jgi:pimeloyl-ACP methyl ester carboxylesterase
VAQADVSASWLNFRQCLKPLCAPIPSASLHRLEFPALLRRVRTVGTPSMVDLTEYRIGVPQQRLDAIRDAIAAFDWDDFPDLAESEDPWSAGTSSAFLRRLCAYWTSGFDWRAQEAAINRFPQFMADIGGQRIHLLRERGSGPSDTALVLTHGWPGSIVEFLGVIERLAHPERFGGEAADGVDVVVPALPGFGFSDRPHAPVGPRRISGMWDRLLREGLGYKRYIAQGGDWGSMVSAMAGLDHSTAKGGGCEAIHLNFLGSRVDGDIETEEDRAYEARCQPFLRDGRAYSETNRTRPQTLGLAMHNNPVGQAAWITDKFHAWSDLGGGEPDRVFGFDQLLTNIMLYVATGSFTTSSWIYRAAQHEVMRNLPRGTRIEVPTAFASFSHELRPLPPRGLLERTYNLVQFTEFEQGGHFAALERPNEFVADVAKWVRLVRDARSSAPTSQTG